jgi:hypothetical protein
MHSSGVEMTLDPVIMSDGRSWKNSAFVDLTFVWDVVWQLC